MQILAAITLQKLTSPLVLFGLAGQFVFMTRFVVQWLVSEKKGKSHVPIAFWWLSLAGGLMLAVYGVLDEDPVILLGQSLGLFIYIRNLVLIYRRRLRIRSRRSLPAEPVLLDTDLDAAPDATDSSNQMTTR